LTLPYSGVFEPDNTLPNLVSDPPVSISNQPAGKSAHLWDDGVGEDLRNLDAKMDEVLRALDADIQLIDKTRK
jgi:hypothetical protein